MSLRASVAASRPLIRRLLAVLVLLWLGLWFAGSQYRSLLEPDEGRYAEVPREMVASGDWVTPRSDGIKFFDKPALQYWGTALAYEAFGLHNWTARLWGLLTGLAGMLAVGWAGARVFGRRAGAIAALALGGSLLWVLGSHINTLDLGVSAFFAIALGAFVVAQHAGTGARARRGLMLGMWAALAAAVLSKGLIGVVFPGGALFFYLLWTRDWALLKRVELPWGLALLLALTLPWFIVVSRDNPEFFHHFFIREHFTRFLTDKDDRAQPFWFFLPVVALGFFPWTAFLPEALRLPPRATGFDARRLLWIWTLMILVFFSVSHSKLPLYILPIFPSLALLIGATAAALSGRALAWRLGIGAVLVAVAAPFALRAHVPVKLAALAVRYQGFMHLAALAAGLGAIALLIAAVLALRGRTRSALVMTGLIGLALPQTLLIGFQTLAPIYSAAPMAAAIAPYLAPGEPVYTVGAYRRGLPFYLDRTVTIAAEDPYDLRAGVRWNPERLIPNLTDFAAAWRARADGVAVMRPDLYAELAAQGLPMHTLARGPDWVAVQRQRVAGTRP